MTNETLSLLSDSNAMECVWQELARRVGSLDGWQCMGPSARVPGALAFRLRGEHSVTGQTVWEHIGAQGGV